MISLTSHRSSREKKLFSHGLWSMTWAAVVVSFLWSAIAFPPLQRAVMTRARMSCWVQRASFPKSRPVFVPPALLHSGARCDSVRPGWVIKKAKSCERLQNRSQSLLHLFFSFWPFCSACSIPLKMSLLWPKTPENTEKLSCCSVGPLSAHSQSASDVSMLYLILFFF